MLEAMGILCRGHEGDSVLQILAAQDLQLAADTAGRRFEPRQAAEILEHALEPSEIPVSRATQCGLIDVGVRALLKNGMVAVNG